MKWGRAAFLAFKYHILSQIMWNFSKLSINNYCLQHGKKNKDHLKSKILSSSYVSYFLTFFYKKSQNHFNFNFFSIDIPETGRIQKDRIGIYQDRVMFFMLCITSYALLLLLLIKLHNHQLFIPNVQKAFRERVSYSLNYKVT